MNIGEEKNYVYELISELITERRKLTEEIHLWKERLNQLLEMEELGIKEVDILGMVDMRNAQLNNQEIENLKREFNARFEALEKRKEKEKEEKSIIPKQVIEEAKERDSKNKPVKSLDAITATPQIISVLKEAGRPVKLVHLKQLLEDKLEARIDGDNFSKNIIRQAMERDSRIVRASRGYYQYKN